MCINAFVDGETNIFQAYYIVFVRDLILSFPPRPRRKYSLMICSKMPVVSFSIKNSLDTHTRIWVDGEWNGP